MKTILHAKRWITGSEGREFLVGHVSQECAGLDTSRALYLDKNPVVTGVRKAVWERNLTVGRSVIHAGHLVLSARALSQADGSHGDRSSRMHMREHLAICADEGRVTGRSHVVFKIASRLAGLVHHAEPEPDRHVGFQWLGVALPNHAVAIGERACLVTSGAPRTSRVIAPHLLTPVLL